MHRVDHSRNWVIADFCGQAFGALHQGLHLQDGMALLGQPAVQFFAIAGDGFVGDHVAEILNAVQFHGGTIIVANRSTGGLRFEFALKKSSQG